MPLDGVVSMYVAAELAGRLNGGRVDKIGQPKPFALLISLRNQGRTHRLYLDANPQQPQIGLLSGSLPNPERAPRFTMILRKHLLGAELAGVECFDYERVFSFRFLAKNEMGDLVSLTLIAELMGRHSNIVLVNKDLRIIDAVRHIDSRVNRVRETLPAHPYIAPPRQDKLTPPEMLAALQSGTDPFGTSPRTIHEQIVRTTSGISPFLAREAEHLANLGDRQIAGLSPAERQLALAMYETFLIRICSGEPSPTVYYAPGTTKPVDFHVFSLAYLKDKKTVDDLFLAMEQVAVQADADTTFAKHKAALQKQLRSRIAHADKRITIHAADLAEGDRAEQLKMSADLIYAYLHRIEPGTRDIQLPDFTTGEPVTVTLDSKLTPAKNAERYYRRYRKSKIKREVASKFLIKDRSLRDYLASLETALEHASEPADLEALGDELASAKRREPGRHVSADADERPGRPASKKRRAMARKKKEPKQKANKPGDVRPGYRAFLSSSGFTILIGRNNLQNDRLTLRDAAKEDLWLHVHQAPGAHVIVKARLEDLPDGDVLEAAGLAAWFSSLNKGAESAVDVDYCPAGRVRKGSGQRPGQVIYEGYYQVRVAPQNPALLRPGDAP